MCMLIGNWSLLGPKYWGKHPVRPGGTMGNRIGDYYGGIYRVPDNTRPWWLEWVVCCLVLLTHIMGQIKGGAGMETEINQKRTHTTIEIYPETVVWKYMTWLNAA